MREIKGGQGGGVSDLLQIVSSPMKGDRTIVMSITNNRQSAP